MGLIDFLTFQGGPGGPGLPGSKGDMGPRVRDNPTHLVTNTNEFWL